MDFITKNKIIFFIGPSGSGKDTYFARVLKDYQVQPIVLFTNRPMREGEQNGREYNFVTLEQLDLLEKQNLLVERRNYDTKYGLWSYATSKENIYLDKYNYVTPNTWEAYSQFLKHYSNNSLIPLYFQLDEGIRFGRCLDRERKSGNGKYAEMCRRFLSDSNDFTQEMIDIYHPYIIDNNGTYEETVEQIDDILVRKLEILRK